MSAVSTFTTISPITGEGIITRNFATDNEIEQTIQASSKAFKQWSKTNLEERIEILNKFIMFLLEDKVALAKELTELMGRPVRYTCGELDTLALRAKHMIQLAKEALQSYITQDDNQFKKYIKRVPLGPVLLICPWNYPYITSINGLVPALLAGDTVLMKHSPQTPTVAEHYKKYLTKAGLPDGVFEVLHLSNEDVAKVVRHPEIKFVNFTGSVQNGYQVQRAASEKFMATGLELGGKDAAYVMEDADIDYSAEQLVDGAMFNSGQSCCSIERIYVHEKIYDNFVNKFVEVTKGYVLDDPRLETTTLGPMVAIKSAQFVRKQIEEAVQKGAKTLIDESLFPKSKEGTTYLAPQVLVNVDHKMSIMTEESFGPVVGIMKVSSDAEALSLINDSEFGLTCSLWTTSPTSETTIALADQIEVGTVFVNRCDYPDPSLAWTGVKNSGRGVTLSHLGFDAFTRPKSFHVKL